MSADAPRRLGRGLEALISTARAQHQDSAPSGGTPREPSSPLLVVPIGSIKPNRFQPRRTFAETDLAELEASIRINGLIQPITVRARPNGDWELIAGERRLRAAIRLGWEKIPVLVRDFDDRAALTLALVENLQRADLNPLEEAEGYQRLIEDFELTQQQVADAVGKDRTTITNLLRVLTLPSAVRTMVEHGRLTTGHARALLTIRDQRKQIELANKIVARQLSVREAEAHAREISATVTPPAKAKRQSPENIPEADPIVRRVTEQLRRRFQTDVSIEGLGNERGVLHVSFYSHDDLERILDLVLGHNRSDFD